MNSPFLRRPNSMTSLIRLHQQSLAGSALGPELKEFVVQRIGIAQRGRSWRHLLSARYARGGSKAPGNQRNAERFHDSGGWSSHHLCLRTVGRLLPVQGFGSDCVTPIHIRTFSGEGSTSLSRGSRGRLRPLAVLLVADLLSATGAMAQASGDAAAGNYLAQRWCSTCHVVNPAQQSGSAAGAPTFEAIAHMKSTTRLSLHAFLQTNHGQMPDFRLSRSEINDVAEYIVNLKKRTE